MLLTPLPVEPASKRCSLLPVLMHMHGGAHHSFLLSASNSAPVLPASCCGIDRQCCIGNRPLSSNKDSTGIAGMLGSTGETSALQYGLSLNAGWLLPKSSTNLQVRQDSNTYVWHYWYLQESGTCQSTAVADHEPARHSHAAILTACNVSNASMKV